MDRNGNPGMRDTLRLLARHFPRYVRLTRRLVADSRISALDKAPLVGAIGYGISPIDLVPGIIPIVGQLDDMVVLLISLRVTLDRIAPEIANEHLMSVGLLRADIDDDIDNCRRVVTTIVSRGARGAAKIAETSAHISLSLARTGLRALRDR